MIRLLRKTRLLKQIIKFPKWMTTFNYYVEIQFMKRELKNVPFGRNLKDNVKSSSDIKRLPESKIELLDSS